MIHYHTGGSVLERAAAGTEMTAEEWFERGTALTCTGRYAEAIGCFDHALEQEPESPRVLVALGVAVDRLGLFRETILCCERALETDPGLFRCVVPERPCPLPAGAVPGRH